jgi:hypothetical protein
MDMYEGQILWVESLKELDVKGAGIQELINAGCTHSAVSKEEPLVAAVSCWSSSIALPGIEQSREFPLVVVALPPSFKDDLCPLASTPLDLPVVEGNTWPYRTTYLQLVGKNNIIRFTADELLPVLRMTPIGSVVMLMVCGDEVLLVEFFCDRKMFLKICHRMHLDNVINEAEDPGIYLGRTSSVKQENDVNVYLPAMYVLDTDEGFFYGVLRGGETDIPQ